MRLSPIARDWSLPNPASANLVRMLAIRERWSLDHARVSSARIKSTYGGLAESELPHWRKRFLIAPESFERSSSTASRNCSGAASAKIGNRPPKVAHCSQDVPGANKSRTSLGGTSGTESTRVARSGLVPINARVRASPSRMESLCGKTLPMTVAMGCSEAESSKRGDAWPGLRLTHQRT